MFFWYNARNPGRKHFFTHARLIVLVLFCIFIPGAAFGGEVLVSADISPKTVQVGDVISMKIFIRHLPGFSLYLPDSIDLAPFDIIDTNVETTKIENDYFSRAVFKMAIYQPGVFSIPGINLLLKSDSERIEVSVPERKVEITSILSKRKNFLADIYPPIDIKQSYLNFLIYVWSVSFIMLVSTVYYFKVKRKKIKEPRVKPVKKEDPAEAALRMLRNIFSVDSLGSLHDKELCERVSFTVKYFVKEKFSVDSLEMTTYELINRLHDLELTEGYLTALYRLLDDCDMVKFANFSLGRTGGGESDIENMRANAFAVVEGRGLGDKV